MAYFAPLSQNSQVELLAAGDSIWIAPSVTISASGGGQAGIRGDFANLSAVIFGAVISTNLVGLYFDAGLTEQGHTVDIREGGQIVSFSGGTSAVRLWGFGSVVENAGLIHGRAEGVVMGGEGAGTTSWITNSGTIVSPEGEAVGHPTIDTMVLNNSGLISGAVLSYSGDEGIDKITNTGRMIGNLELGSGNDTYSGASGRLTGLIMAGDGNDVVTGGQDGNEFRGGVGNDTLTGNGGNDLLNGEGGIDKLTGGLGKDTLRGGADNDRFVFSAVSHSVVGANADRILDFDDAGNDTIDLGALFGSAMTYRHNLAFSAVGQVRINDIAGADVVVEVNNAGSLAPDFSIRLTATTLASMTASDFVL
jgi:Ca2+-binding RTX toxin-like protein